MKILSIQSWVADGHVGNAAALFPLQRLGAEIAAIHTVQFSNHPGHGAYAGRAYPATDTLALIDGLAAHGALQTCDALLTGYIGNAATGAALLHAAIALRAANPAALWCCDPVMGDDNRLYVAADIPAAFAAALPQADLLTPNRFELAQLTGTPCDTLQDAAAAAAALRHRLRSSGPRAVLVTSLHTADTPPGAVQALLAAAPGLFLIETDRLPAKFSGAGDLLAALFLYHVLATADPLAAATRAIESLAGVLHATHKAGAAELQIIAAQNEFIAPTRRARVKNLLS